MTTKPAEPIDGEALEQALSDPFAERQLPFGGNQAVLEASRCLYCYDAPCMIACPTSIDIPGFIRSIATDDSLGAAGTIMRSNIMGASCGRVCETEALCEGACVLHPTEKPIEIGRLQRHATDTLIADGRGIPYVVGESSGKKVAIVGGGPAGLSAAANLRESGHAVTIYERQKRLGGLAAYGIIPVREPNEVVEWEVEQVLALGVKAKTSTEVGVDIEAGKLLEEYDAVLVTVGAGRFVQDIALANSDAAGVEDALVFIEKSRTRKPGQIELGKRVVVVGGGNTAMDAATIAVQLAAPSVACVYRRTAEDMTAYPTEVDFCLRKGVAFSFLTQPVSVVVGPDGRATGLECARVVQGEPDESGRRAPIVSDERFVIEADHILLATGQSREPKVLADLGIEVARDGRPAVDALGQTSVAGIFACGDAVSAGADLSVVAAVQQGKDAAAGIDRFLAPVGAVV